MGVREIDRCQSPVREIRLVQADHPDRASRSPPPNLGISLYTSSDYQVNVSSAHALHFQHSWRPLIYAYVTLIQHDAIPHTDVGFVKSLTRTPAICDFDTAGDGL